MTSIVVDVREAVAWITLDSPPVNALSMVLIDELSAALVAYRPPDVRAVVIRATRGASVFSAGHDVRELPTNGRDPSHTTIRSGRWSARLRPTRLR